MQVSDIGIKLRFFFRLKVKLELILSSPIKIELMHSVSDQLLVVLQFSKNKCIIQHQEIEHC